MTEDLALAPVKPLSLEAYFMNLDHGQLWYGGRAFNNKRVALHDSATLFIVFMILKPVAGSCSHSG